MSSATLEPAMDTLIPLPVPGLTHALLAPAGADLALGTSWLPRLDGRDLADATTAAVLQVDLPAGHPFWARAAHTAAGVAVAAMSVAGEPAAVHVTACHAGHAPVTVLVDASSCAAAALFNAAAIQGQLEISPAEAPTQAPVTLALPDASHVRAVAAAHATACRTCR